MLVFAFVLLCMNFISILESRERKGSARYEVVENPSNEVMEKEIKWTLMPDGRGEVRVAILDGLQPRSQPDTFEGVKFLLYTRRNPKKPEVGILNSTCRPIFSNYNPKKRSKVLIHGFGDDAKGSLMYPIITEAFLAKGDFNVFQVDWGDLAGIPWYSSAKENTVLVGQHTATLIDHLVISKKGRAEDFHVIGFSLGAHVAGVTANSVQTGSIKRVTGLDPARVMYGSTEEVSRLDAKDAESVEVLHTSGGYLGYQEALGTRDFYPNGGSWPQPGCVFDFAAVCSHRRAYYYYGEALENSRGFAAVPCQNYEDFKEGSCWNNTRDLIQLGEAPSKEQKGTFYLDTNSEAPFGLIGKQTSQNYVEEIK